MPRIHATRSVCLIIGCHIDVNSISPTAHHTIMSEDSVLFRAPKRRKVFRNRPIEDDEIVSFIPATITVDTPPTLNDDDNTPSANAGSALQALLRQKRLLKSRRGGLAFSHAPNPDRSTPVELDDADEAEVAPTALAAAAGRFATEIGHKVVSNDNVM
jgi:hypothetical protein